MTFCVVYSGQVIVLNLRFVSMVRVLRGLLHVWERMSPMCALWPLLYTYGRVIALIQVELYLEIVKM